MAWSEKLPSGKYRALYRDKTGKRRSAGTYKHKREAEQQAAAAELESRRTGWRDPDAGEMPWAAWVDRWWPTRAVEPGTLKVDAGRLNRHLMPRWGDTPLADITRHDIRAWVADLGRTDLSPATVQRCLSLLSASLAAAVDAEILPANPASRIQIVKGETAEQRYLTRTEYQAIAEHIHDPYDLALLHLLVGTGMRWGEAIGLQIPRIDLNRGVVRVSETWSNRLRTMKPYPKGRRIRDVPLPDWVAEPLAAVIGDRRIGPVWARDGKLPDYHNWRTRVWLPALRAAEVGHVRPHDLRHTYASWLIQAGVSLEEVGRLLGHKSPLTTRVYAHLADSPRDHILAALSDPSRGADVGQNSASPGYTTLRLVT